MLSQDTDVNITVQIASYSVITLKSKNIMGYSILLSTLCMVWQMYYVTLW